MNKEKIEKKIQELRFGKTIYDVLDSKRFNYAFQHGNWEKLIKKLDDNNLSPEESTYLHLYNLLYTLEGPMNFVINAVIYTLIKDGHHDVWSENKRKFISAFDDIFDLPLSTRLKFLNAHGFKFFSDICPRKIRNSIAHQSFLIESDGGISIERKKWSLSEIISINERMIDVVKIFVEAI